MKLKSRREIQSFSHNGCQVRMFLTLHRTQHSRIYETVGIEVEINGRVVDSIDFVFDLTRITTLLVTPEDGSMPLGAHNEGSHAP
jgi:hypothetical protein